MSNRITVNTTLDETLIKEIKILAIQEGKRMNDLIEEAIKAFLAKKK